MKFYKGDKVFLTESREVGFVTRVDDEQLLFVEVDGMEIPVFTSDITKDIPKEFQSVEKSVPPPDYSPRKISHLEELGLFICFEQQLVGDEITEFNIYLINSFQSELAFAFQFLLGDEEIFSLKQNILPQDSMLLFTISYDELNENPSFNLLVKRKGLDKKELTFAQRIKPNNLFNKKQRLPFFVEEVYAYRLIEYWPVQPVIKKEDYKAANLKAIEEGIRNRLNAEEPAPKNVMRGPVLTEIDLHIENLVEERGQMSNGEIMQIQLSRFRDALENAIVGGIETFYVIHGIGKGKLREEIFRILPEYKAVKSFKNEYHHKYGFGATEIRLK